jgi:hypothetical protein
MLVACIRMPHHHLRIGLGVRLTSARSLAGHRDLGSRVSFSYPTDVSGIGPSRNRTSGIGT